MKNREIPKPERTPAWMMRLFDKRMGLCPTSRSLRGLFKSHYQIKEKKL